MPRPKSPSKPARDRAIARDYPAATQADLASRYGLTQSTISKILKDQGARLTGERLRERLTPINRATAARPDFRDRVRLGLAKARASGKARGRPRLPLLEHERPQYEKLRRHFGAAYAREQMWVPE